MERLRQSRRTFNNYLSELDDWATSAHLAQAYLLVANFFLSLKASTNILAFLSNSTDLITDYNGLTLFSALFNRCFFLLNLMVFVSSIFCLLALMLTLKHNSLRLLLIHCFTFSQIALIVVIMILMACLWLSPIRVDLAENFPEWRNEIANYDYRLSKSLIRWSSIEGDELEDVYETLLRDDDDHHHLNQHQPKGTPQNELHTSENEPPRRPYVIEVQTFARQIDMLQRSLECCGIQDRNDWATYNSEWQLVAPSCCRNPSALLIGRKHSLLKNKTSRTNGVDGGVAHGAMVNGSSQISRLPRSRATAAEELIYYCPFNDNNIIGAGRLARRRGDVIIRAIHGQGQLNDDTATTRGSGPRMSRDELLELQLAIEWTGPPRSGNFVLNQAQNLQLSIVYGCQRTLDDRLASCLLALRLRLLILVSFLTLNVIARSAALESKPARRNRSHHRHHHHHHHHHHQHQNVHQGMVISAI